MASTAEQELDALLKNSGHSADDELDSLVQGDADAASGSPQTPQGLPSLDDMRTGAANLVQSIPGVGSWLAQRGLELQQARHELVQHYNDGQMRPGVAMGAAAAGAGTGLVGTMQDIEGLGLGLAKKALDNSPLQWGWNAGRGLAGGAPQSLSSMIPQMPDAVKGITDNPWIKKLQEAAPGSFGTGQTVGQFLPVGVDPEMLAAPIMEAGAKLAPGLAAKLSAEAAAHPLAAMAAKGASSGAAYNAMLDAGARANQGGEPIPSMESILSGAMLGMVSGAAHGAFRKSAGIPDEGAAGTIARKEPEADPIAELLGAEPTTERMKLAKAYHDMPGLSFDPRAVESGEVNPEAATPAPDLSMLAPQERPATDVGGFKPAVEQPIRKVSGSTLPDLAPPMELQKETPALDKGTETVTGEVLGQKRGTAAPLTEPIKEATPATTEAPTVGEFIKNNVWKEGEYGVVRGKGNKLLLKGPDGNIEAEASYGKTGTKMNAGMKLRLLQDRLEQFRNAHKEMPDPNEAPFESSGKDYSVEPVSPDKLPHELTQDDYVRQQLDSGKSGLQLMAEHQLAVQKAIDGGEKIAPEVLADYPKLASKPPTAEHFEEMGLSKTEAMKQARQAAKAAIQSGKAEAPMPIDKAQKLAADETAGIDADWRKEIQTQKQSHVGKGMDAFNSLQPPEKLGAGWTKSEEAKAHKEMLLQQKDAYEPLPGENRDDWRERIAALLHPSNYSGTGAGADDQSKKPGGPSGVSMASVLGPFTPKPNLGAHGYTTPELKNSVAAGVERAKKYIGGFAHGEASPQILSRVAGVQTNSDIVRQYDPTMAEARDRWLADKEKLSVDVEHPRSQAQLDAWRDAHSMTPDEIRSSPDLQALNHGQREFLASSKELDAHFKENYLEPSIKALEDAGHKVDFNKGNFGLTGNNRLLRILKDDADQMSGKGNAPGILDVMRGGIYRSIFLGNQEVAGLHAIEAAAAGASYDPLAGADALKLVTTGNKTAWDFMDAYKTKGMDARQIEGARIPLARALDKLTQPIIDKVESVKGGKTAIDFLRAQIPEKAKTGLIRVAMASKQARELNYPGGTESLMKDLLASARGQQLPDDRALLASKAEVNIYRDMNRLIMHSPLGWSERTMFQRHAMLSWAFPFLRSRIQQARLIHSYGEDILRNVGKGDFGHAAVGVSRGLVMFGMLAGATGAAAVPREIDEALKEYDYNNHTKTYKRFRDAIDALTLNVPTYRSITGQTVPHVQPSLFPLYQAAHGGNDLISGLARDMKPLFDWNNPKTDAYKKTKAVVTMAALAELDSIGGLIGTSKALQLVKKIGEGMKGKTKQYAFSEDGRDRMLGKRTFKTDAGKSTLDWLVPGIPNDIYQWMEKRQDADFNKQMKKHKQA